MRKWNNCILIALRWYLVVKSRQRDKHFSFEKVKIKLET